MWMIWLGWHGNINGLKLFIDYVNAIHSKNKFTYELEDQKLLTIPDLTIKNVNKKHIFETYRTVSTLILMNTV